MGHPTEREPAPEPTSDQPAEPDQAGAPDEPGDAAEPQPVPAEPSAPAEPAEPSTPVEPAEQSAPAEPAEPAVAPVTPGEDVPYEPAVRAYEQRVIATVAAPTPAGPPTQALPLVAAESSTASMASEPGQGGEPPVGSPLDGLAGDGAPSRLPKVAMWTGIGLVVVAGVYAGAQWAVADTVADGTSVSGVAIGGMTQDEALSALDQGLGPRAAEPFTVQAGEASTTVDPATAGLTFDAASTVDGLTGFTLSPARLWEHMVGGSEIAPVVDVDSAALGASVASLEESLRVEPVDGTVSFSDGEAVATEAVEGSTIVVDEATDVISSGWLVQPDPYTLPTEAVVPQIDQDETDAAFAQAEQVVSGPVVVNVGGQKAELPADELAAATSFKPVDGALEQKVDGEKVVDAVVERTNDLLTDPDDAHFEFSNGKPVVVGGEPGTTLDPDATAEAVAAAETSEDRTADLELVERDPERTKEALEDMGVDEVVSSFSTPLTSEPIRTKNLARGAEIITGTLVAPGETFSLVDTLSPIDASNGFYAAGVVNNGVHTDAVGGGLSQMATTTYNAGFFAGFDDAGHRQHSYWFSRYPAGREATIYVGSIDMQFTNDTPYGAVLRSWISGGELHVEIWSTPYYEVKNWAGDKTNVVRTTTVHKTGAACENYPAGNDGFSITNYRQVFLDGEMVKDESYPWTYKPDNGVVCDAPKKDKDKDEDTETETDD